MPNIDGLVRLRNTIRKESHMMDVANAHKGIGLVVYLAQVRDPAPDFTVVVNGAVNFVEDDFTLSVSGGDLIVPTHIRPAVGDIVAIAPISGGRRWLVLCTTSDNEFIPVKNARLGMNGDKAGNDFVGVEISVPDGDSAGSGSVLVAGETISITSFGGSSVVIDGLNFKGHHHSIPAGTNVGGGTSGGAA